MGAAGVLFLCSAGEAIAGRDLPSIRDLLMAILLTLWSRLWR